MKILFVDQSGLLGGGELSLLDIIRHSNTDAEVVLFTDGPFRKLLEDLPVPVHLLESSISSHIRREAGLGAILASVPSMLRLRSNLRNLACDFDVIYANSQKAFLISAIARRRGQKLIWHLRDMLTPEHFSILTRKTATLAGNYSATAIIVNSIATGESFVQQGGQPHKVTTIHNGIASEPFDAVDEAQIQQARAQLGLENKFVVGVFGRLTPWKGQGVLIEAVAQVPGVHAIVVGDALFGEIAYAEELRVLARTKGVEQRTHFVGFRRDIAVLMKMCDLIVHCSTSPEPFGRVIVEGMLAGRPVIAARAGGAMEIVQDGESGILVAPGSVLELSDAIAKLKNDPALATAIAGAGRQRAIKHFSVDAMVHKIAEVLRSVSGNPE